MYHQKRFKHIRSQSKYKNKVGITSLGKFDSKLESKVGQDLEFLRQAGEIKRFERQVKIEFNFLCKKNPALTIVPGIKLKESGKPFHHLFNYYVDFKVYHNDKTIEFIEVKGLWLEPGKTKWRLLEIYFADKPQYRLTVIKK